MARSVYVIGGDGGPQKIGISIDVTANPDVFRITLRRWVRTRGLNGPLAVIGNGRGIANPGRRSRPSAVSPGSVTPRRKHGC
jgi:hypothetical protein